MKKLIILVLISVFMVSCIKHKPVVSAPPLTDKEYIEKEEKEFKKIIKKGKTELFYYKKGFDAMNDGYQLAAISLFQIVVSMKGEKAEKARSFIKVIKHDVKNIKRFNIFLQKDKELEISSEALFIEIKSWLSVFLNDKEIPEQMAVFLGRLYKNLLKEGFTKRQAMELMTNPFDGVSLNN